MVVHRCVPWFAAFAIVLGGGALIHSDPNGPLASGQLEIQGNRLTIYDDGEANDAQQTIDIGERASVRTCYGGQTNQCDPIAPGDPRIAGLSVLAELRGPELPQAVPLRTTPGGAFELPAFQQEGDYFLENIRLVNDATGAVLGPAEPSVAILQVRQIALASASVTTLSLEDLAARGISITQENFQAFNFAVGFYFGTELVTIDLPVIYQGNGQVDPLSQPSVSLDGLPPEIQHTVSRWQPPSITPFTLEIPELDPLDVSEELFEPITFPIFGAIVMPGNVSFLNQFFDAKLIIANGAPAGSQVDLDNLLATLRLPDGNVLRIAETEPPVGAGQPVPVLTDVGDHVIPPVGQGAASWTVEGLVAGTHILQMDVEGELVRPGRETVPVVTRAQAAVEVVDARFHLTFSHPDVVREGSTYSLFVTVANLSQVAQNGVTVSIEDGAVTGAHKMDPSDDFIRPVGTVLPGQTLTTLQPGQSETVEYRLVADVTGQVLGGTFETSSPQGAGAIQLYTGVGELGIPLSPATLRLPRFSERLSTPYTTDDGFFVGAMRFLGLAYSLAVAPAGMTPQGLPHVIRADVEARAIDMGFAGQRSFLDEKILESLEVLALDWLGNRDGLAEIDELRRRTDKGVLAYAGLAGLLRHEQNQRGLSALTLFDHFAETTSYTGSYIAAAESDSYTGGYIAAMLAPTLGQDPPVLEVSRSTDDEWTHLTGFAGDPDRMRSLPYGGILELDELPGGGDRVPLALVGNVKTDQLFEVLLHNTTDADTAGQLLLIIPDGSTGDYRKLDFGTVTVPPHSVYAVTIGADVADPVSGGFTLSNTTTSEPVAGVTASKTQVLLPPFRLIGARQDYRIAENTPENLYGHAVSYLFNRPPDQASGESADSYRIESSFSGLDVRGDPFAATSELAGAQAFLQPSERVVNVRYDRPLSSLVDPATDEPLVTHHHLIDPPAITDRWGNSLYSIIPEPQIDTDPVRVGGLLSGKVLRGTGVPAQGALIQLVRPRHQDSPVGFATKLDLVAEAVTGPDGAFFFDFIETPHANPYVEDSFKLRAIVPEGTDPATEPAGVEEVGSTIRQQNRVAYINIAMLGRGTLTGRLIYLDTGEPVPEGRVTVSSTLFQDSKTVAIEADGSFEALAMPVGPLTLTGRDIEGRAVYATVGLAQPGGVVDVLLELPRTQPPGLGSVVGTVYRLATGDPLPGQAVAGAQVEVYSAGASLGRVETDGFGHFRFNDIPEGQITVQAADFRISRTAVVADLLLAADEVAEITLTLPESQSRTVTGRVLFYDPVTNGHLPVVNQPAFISGPGIYAYTDVDGRYRIEGVPVQAAGASPYRVSAIDYERKLQGDVLLPPILDTSPEEVVAQDIVLREMRGSIRGVVLDPLGRPLGGAKIVAAWVGVPYLEANSLSDGSFSFNDLPLGEWTLTAHVGDGLQPDKVGYFGDTETEIVFGGHSPFVSIRLAGSGVVNVYVKTEANSVITSEIYYRPTYFSEAAKSITIKGTAIETQAPNGFIALELPVGSFEITAFSPFHGVRSATGTVGWAGQIQDVNLVFGSASTVTGTLVGVDGTTPIPDFAVVLETSTLLPQTQHTDAQGRFQFELVPEGAVRVTAQGLVGAVERVGIANGHLSGGGHNLDLTVRMKAQGTVKGQVFERIGDDLQPLPFAQYYVRENSYPYRRLPSSDGWYTTDGDGRYQVSRVFAGSVTVVARDSSQNSRQGSARRAITSDWQLVQMPDIVMSTSVGSIEITIRDPETGGVLPDTQVTLRQSSTFSEMTVADSAGLAVYDALPLGTYWVYAFHAPTGRSGVRYALTLGEPKQVLATTLYVDQPGEVAGTLYDDTAKDFPVPGGTIRLSGSTAGGGLTALDTTSGQQETLGEFSFLGIPEGTFTLSAGISGSNRRAGGKVSVTATAPQALIDLILEPAGEVAFRVFESLSSGLNEVDPSTILLSSRLQQGESYDFNLLQPTGPYLGHYYLYPNVLLERSCLLTVQELAGERRRSQTFCKDFLDQEELPWNGSGTIADPYQIVLGPKGVVRVTVHDAGAIPVPGANVTLVASGGTTFPSVTDGSGQVVFTAVPAGDLTASASASHLGVTGRSTASLEFDDDVIDVVVDLQPSVSAHGYVYQPVPGDLYNGDPSTLVPQEGATVDFSYAGHHLAMTTGPDGAYRFDALPEGTHYTVSANSPNGQAEAYAAGTLVGPDGHQNEIEMLILDGGPPQVLSIVPPPGMEEVSRTAIVEIVFSEPLRGEFLPSGQSTSIYFEVRGPHGLANGVWTSGLNAERRQVVRFVPSNPYDNNSVYSLKITGGASGVRDLAGRQLTVEGDVGSNFKTSDSIGPKVLTTDPTLGRPVDPEATLRFDFNESLVGSDDQIRDAAHLYWAQDDGAGGLIWEPEPLVVTVFLTRSNYSLSIDPQEEGYVLLDDSLARRVVIDGLEDSQGNPMPDPYVAEFRVWDETSPVIDDLPVPPTAPTGDLVPGTAYVLTPVLSGVDHLPYDPAEGDIDRVDYFFSDPTAPDAPTQPDVSVSAPPYSFGFIAAYSGNGVDPRPFPVWARAVDTSTNESNVAFVEMQVLPNQPPTVGAVDATALSPVAGVTYAGSTLQATVSGLGDPDGSELALRLELWRVAGALVDGPVSLSVQRPPTGWGDLTPPTATLNLPIAESEGAELIVRAVATDDNGASATLDSAPFAVADDQGLPITEGIVVRDAGDGSPRSLFHIGDELYVEFTVRDLETAVLGAEVGFDRSDIFPSPQTATRFSGDLYRTPTLTVPADLFTETTPIELTITADDRGGNSAATTFGFEIAPAPDPTAPTVEWLTPWEGGAWPAGYTSMVSPGVGTALLLRVHAKDLSDDGAGGTIPGTIIDVLFRGPVDDGAGGIELAATPIPGSLVPDTAAPGEGHYQAVWLVPDQIANATDIPFEVRVIDTGNLDIVSTIRLQTRAYRRVYEAAITSVGATETMLTAGGVESGAVFLLGGTVLSIYPQTDGSVRNLNSVHLYAGGQDNAGTIAVHSTVLTAPEVSSYGSPVLYNPLELDITETLAVGAGARIDVSRRGLLGCTSDDAMVLPGETRSEARAGGSHGGLGWFGAPSSWGSTSTRYQPSSSFGSVRSPHLPGAGGGGWGTTPGGNGGGVIRLLAENATVRISGDVLADGGSSAVGGGAGGAISITAGRIEGRGAISARGGDSTDADRSAGGGGGRIALSFRELGGDADLVGQIDARGGGNGGTFLGGAGTIFIDARDPATGESSGVGSLLVVNNDGPPAASTLLPSLGDGVVVDVDPTGRLVTLATIDTLGSIPGEILVLEDDGGLTIGLFGIVSQLPVAGGVELSVDATETELYDLLAAMGSGAVSAHGRARYSEVVAEGVVRLAFDDDVEIGLVDDPDPALNDPASLTLLGGNARALVRGVEPIVTLAATPEPGTDVGVGSSISVSWTATDPVGFATSSETWPLDGYSRTRPSDSQPLTRTVDPDPLLLAVPADAPAGPAIYTVTVTDVAGRMTEQQLSWNILPNAAPTVTLTFGDGAPTAVQAGFATTVEVHAEDAEGVASVTLTATGPAVAATQTTVISGTVVDLPFTVEVLPDADGATPIVLQAAVTDTTGLTVASNTLQVTVTPDLTLPTAAIELAPVAVDDTYIAGDTVTITAGATDDVSVTSLAATFDGDTTVTTGEPIVLNWVAPPVTESTVFPINVEAHDPSGNLGTATRTLTIDPLDNPEAPVVSIGCPLNGDFVAPGVPIGIAVSVTDDDDIIDVSLWVDGVEYGSPVSVNTTSYSGTLSWTPPMDAVPGQNFNITVKARDYVPNTGSRSINLTVIGDTILAGDQTLISAHDGEDLVLAAGTFTATQALTPASLTLLNGAVLTTQTLQQLVIQTPGAVSLSCNSRVDVSGRGYGGDTTYPGATYPSDYRSGGSHLGEGGIQAGTPGETYGSVTRPQENGGGGRDANYGLRGGGAVRIEAQSLDLQGSAAIRANGSGTSNSNYRSGAGGSVWITADVITGSGVIEASGGSVPSLGSGGGGAIAIEYGTMDPAIETGLRSVGGYSASSTRMGAAGTVHLFDTGASTYGDLVVNNADQWSDRRTVLPSLGAGTAQAGSSGVVLETDLASTIPAYFAGHWVEVSQTDGTPKGSWRIEAINGTTLTLETGANVAEGDLWQGAYRFDLLTAAEYGQVRSADPIRTAEVTLTDGGRLEVSEPIEVALLTLGGGANSSIMWSPITATGSVEVVGPGKAYAQSITAPTLTVRGGAFLSQAAVGGSTTVPADLTIQVTDLIIEDGGAIDVSGRGYGGDTTYPGATYPSDYRSGGSHLGEGGIQAGTPGETYGSVTRPQENGGGGRDANYGLRGGGAVRIEAQSLDLQGSAAIRANGSGTSNSNYRSGAGGSVWITADVITGSGVIEASGGSVPSLGSGGGGAIAIEYGTMDPAIETGLRSVGGYSASSTRMGAAGTVHLFDTGASTYGDFVVNNADQWSDRRTVLPSLGAGTAQAGSSGVVLETDLASTIPAYFAGHWVEVSQTDGTPKGSWRIEAMNGTTLTLETGANVAEGDLWQGAYRFDLLTAAEYGQVRSADPIRTAEVTLTDGGRLEVSEPIEVALLTLGGGANSSIMWSPITATGSVEVVGPGKAYAQSITAPTLTVRGGAFLSQAAVGGSTTVPADLTIQVTDLIIEDGGAIDVSGRGYGGDTTYPGATYPSDYRSGGSHLGEGGIQAGTPGETYGSVTRPQENGGGGRDANYGLRGGGAVRIEAQSLDLQGSAAIRANGSGTSNSNYRSGAGGSVWITADVITGSGVIEASGGSVPSLGSGGGGAIAIEYGTMDPAIETGLRSVGGYSASSTRMGAAGTVHLFDTGASTYGDLVVNNADQWSDRRTVLPSLGAGTAQAGSSGVVLETDLASTIPAYFAGHWVEVSQTDGTPKGSWRIEAMNGTTLTLETGANVAEGDLWQGAYRFDLLTAAEYGQVRSADPIRTAEVTLTDGGRLEVSEPIEVALLTLGGGANSSIMWSPFTATGSVEIVGPGKAYAQSITAPTLTVRGGAFLSQAAVGGSTTVPADLTIQVTDLIIEDGGAIDVSGRGYGGDTTYPGATYPSDYRSGGSHLGEGGIQAGTPGETYGSVTRPQENGGGGRDANYGLRGGGAVRIEAQSLDLQGSAAIRANGSGTSNSNYRSGAGGSVWITADVITGSGVIEASGGSVPSLGSGGGGAIAIEYGTMDPAIETGLRSVGGYSASSTRMGAAGTVHLFDTGASTYGDLVVNNADQWSDRRTVLPSLGAGTAQAGSSGVVLETDLASTIPAYFAGHWVEVSQTDGTPKGSWRIEAINGTTLTLETGANVAEGDTWRGIYRFDSLLVTGSAKVRIDDLDEIGSVTVDLGSTLVRANLSGPTIETSLVALESRDGGYAVSGLFGAITDPDGIASASLVNATGGGSWPLVVAADGSFPSVIVTGSGGDILRLDAVDAHAANPRSSSVELGALPGNVAAPLIQTGLMGFTYDGASVHFTGQTDAIVDDNPPVGLLVEDLTSGGSWSTTIAPDGSFDVVITAACGDELRLTATDAHPAPLQSVVDFGPMPDVIPPVVDASRILVRALNRGFLASSMNPSVQDDCSVAGGYLSDPAQPGVEIPVAVQADGTFDDTLLPSTTVGAVLQFTAVDGGGHETTVDLAPLPANDGPPSIYTSQISTSSVDGHYSISSFGSCPPDPKGGASCGYPFTDADAIHVVRFENRATPGFGPHAATVTTGLCSSCPHGLGYLFDPVEVTGAVGDEIWLVAEDGHPQWQSNETLVWTLPAIPGAPTVNLENIGLFYLAGDYRLIATSGGVVDVDDPISIEAAVWRDVVGVWTEITRQTTSIASGAAFELVLPGAAEGDLVALSATDSGDRTNTHRIGTLPAAVAITVSLDVAAVTADEATDEASIPVSLSAAPSAPVTVAYRTVAGTATAGIDYNETSGTLTFTPTFTAASISVDITDDGDVEPDETFQVVLENPSGVELGAITTTDVTIVDDDGAARTVVYSVGVDAANMLAAPIAVDIAGGVATFAEPLPPGPDRGDRVELDNSTVLFIAKWIDDTHFELVEPDGLPASSSTNRTAVSITPAFSSLEAAVDGAGDPDHLDTLDLVSANRTLEILCYGGSGDNTPVTIDGWITSPTHRIRIVAPTAAGQRSGNQRHSGRYDGQAYRLQPWNADALTSTVGNVTIEGLQITNSGYASTPIRMVNFDGVDGDVEILETIIQLDNQTSTAWRSGVSIDAIAPVNLTVRNSVIWDLGDGSSANQFGIVIDDPLVSANLVNNTIVGGAYGIWSGDGTVTAINNLVAGATMGCFDGSFTPESSGNLATDATAPNPPTQGVSPVTVLGDTSGLGADLHLGCNVLDQALTLTSTPIDIGSTPDLFDGNSRTLARSAAVNPAWVQLEFDQPRTLTGSEVCVSHGSSHEWTLALADSVADMESQSGTYREMVSSKPIFSTTLPRMWDGVTFADETATVVRLTVQRFTGDDFVHICEWRLDGTNPACGSATDLSASEPWAFSVDVDSQVRLGSWDVGADQARGLTAGLAHHAVDSWEAENEVSVQVVLDAPAAIPVSVSYYTSNGTAFAGEDYLHVEGVLVFEPGETSKFITVPLVDDGPGEGSDEFYVNLTGPAGATLGRDWCSIWIYDEGAPPPRVYLTNDAMVVSESAGTVTIEAELSQPTSEAVAFGWGFVESTGIIGTDVATEGGVVNFDPGTTTASFSIEIIDDALSEGREELLVDIEWRNFSTLGVPNALLLSIIDDDLPPATFASDAVNIGETDGSLVLVVTVDPPPTDPASVEVQLTSGTATEGVDFVISTSTTLEFSPDQPTAAVVIDIVDDSDAEGNETAVLNLANPVGLRIGSPSSITVKIVDNETGGSNAFFVDTWVDGFESTPGIVQLEVAVSPPPAGPVSVDVAIDYSDATLGTDFLLHETTLNFDPINLSRTVDVQILDDAEPEWEEEIELVLTNPQGIGIQSPTIGRVTIYDDDGAQIDENELYLETWECRPYLDVPAGAITSGSPGITVDIFVYNRNYDQTWSTSLSIEGGEAFTVDLQTLDLGSEVEVVATADAGGDEVYAYLNMRDISPDIEPTEITVTPLPGSLQVGLTEYTITDRLADVRLRLVNTTAVTEVPMDDPCAVASPSASIAAIPTDHVELEACHGVLLELCTSHVVQEGGGP